MNLSLTIFQKVTFFLILAFLPLLVWGQADRSSDQEVTVTNTAEVDAAPANYNNSRSSRANVAGPNETNVCDGVTCSDGSCAATVDECSAVAPVADSVCNGFVCNSGECVASEAICDIGSVPAQVSDSVCNGFVCDDGECASSEAMCGITDVVETAADSVCNGYLCDDGECVTSEAMCGIDFDFEVDAAATAVDSVCNGYLCDNGTCRSSEAMCGLPVAGIPDAVATCPVGSPIRCGDGSCSSDVSRCQEIESTMSVAEPVRGRGNAARGQGVDPIDADSDGDGISTDASNNNAPDVVLRGGSFVRAERADGAIDSEQETSSTHCVQQAEDDNGRVYAWGQGLCVALEASDQRSATATARLASLQVDGAEVRAWNSQERSAWNEYRQNRSTTTVDEQVADQLIEQTQSNERIKEIKINDDGVEMRYQAQLRLFGMIPLEREVSARANAQGQLEITYPWYRFLSTAPDQARIEAVLQETMSVRAQLALAAQ